MAARRFANIEIWLRDDSGYKSNELLTLLKPKRILSCILTQHRPFHTAWKNHSDRNTAHACSLELNILRGQQRSATKPQCYEAEPGVRRLHLRHVCL